MASKQHYLPQFFLRGFARPASNGKFWMWQYDKRTGTAIETTTRNVCHQGNFYDWLTPDGFRVEVDGALTDAENRYASVMRRIRARPTVETLAEHRQHLALILSVLHLRSIAIRDEVSKLPESDRKEMLLDLGVPLEAQVAATFEDETKAIHMIRLAKTLEPQAREYLAYPWVLLLNETGIPFCLADYPFGFVGEELIIPLSAELALQFKDKPLTRECTVRRVDIRQIRAINYAQLDASLQYIFGPENRFRWAAKYLNLGRHRESSIRS